MFRELMTAIGRDLNSRPMSTCRGLIKELRDEGEIVMFKGNQSTTYTAAVHRQTLKDLLTKASDQVDPNLSPRAGRRTQVGKSRAVESINEKHFSRIRTVCRAVAKYRFPDAKRSVLDSKLADFGSELFVWNEQDQDWTKFLDLVRKASQDKSQATRRQYISAARQLLDLAATHGWISRTTRHDPDYRPVPAEWAELFNEWRETLMGSGAEQIYSSLIVLFEGCSQCGFHPRGAEWEQVIEHLEDRFKAGGLTVGNPKKVRALYRKARKLSLLAGPDWNGHKRQRMAATTLVRSSAIDQAAAAYGRKKKPEERSPAIRAALEGRQVEWPSEFAAYENGLLSGPYGLKSALTYFSLSGSEADIAGFPHRAFPRNQIRNGRAATKRAWTTSTVRNKLQIVLHCAGWMQENLQGVDWKRDDLRALLDLNHLGAYRKAIYAGRLSTKRALIAKLSVLARLASPFMEAMALKNRDDELADRMAKVSTTLCSQRVLGGRVSWVSSLKQELDVDERSTTQRKNAEIIERVWTRNGQAARFAYQQFRRVRKGLVELLERDHGKLGDQIRAIEKGRDSARSWAREVQEALFWQEQTVVPLRAATLKLLDLEDRHHTSDFRRVWAEIPAWKMKETGNGDFRPNFTKGGDGYERSLYRLYTMAGGAREILLTDKAGRVKNRPMFWVPDVQKFKRERFDSSGLSRLMRRGIKRVLERLEDPLDGVDYEYLEEELKAEKCFGTHSFRHSFATYMVRRGHLQAAAKYLHHKGLKTLQEVYSGTTAAHYDVAEILSSVDADE